ncbi:MAG: D-alanyl-D-alanine carboxypeptidase family protein [Acetobacteraceae bacterium]
MLTRRSAVLGPLTLGSAILAGAVGNTGPAMAAPPERDAARRVHKTLAKSPAPPPATPATTPIGPVGTDAQWVFIEDYTTGAVLAEKQADEEMTPSSMTKLMTLYILFSRLKEGRMKLDSMLPVSRTAWHFGGSKMFVEVGSTVSVEDLIKGIIVDSGNDACIVVAEAIAGSQAQFADLMNQEAKRLGLMQSHFMNPMGWPVPDHYMSVHDIARLTAALIRDFPQYYHYFGDKTFTYSNITQGNRNVLVDNGMADGLKTGHTEAGGFGLVVSAERNGRRVIAVLNGMPSSRERIEQGERLLNWAFANFEDVTLVTAGTPVDQAPVWLGSAHTVPLVVAHDLIVTLPHGWRDKVKVTVDYDTPVPAPVAKGAPLGTLTVAGAGVPDRKVPLLAGASVQRLGLPGRAFAVLMHDLTGR